MLVCLSPGTSTQNIYKTTEGFHFSDEEVECSTANFSGRFFTDHFLGEGINMGTEHSHLSNSEFRFSGKYKANCASTISNHTLFGHGDKLNKYDYNSSTGEKGLESKTISRSSE